MFTFIKYLSPGPLANRLQVCNILHVNSPTMVISFLSISICQQLLWLFIQSSRDFVQLGQDRRLIVSWPYSCFWLDKNWSFTCRILAVFSRQNLDNTRWNSSSARDNFERRYFSPRRVSDSDDSNQVSFCHFRPWISVFLSKISENGNLGQLPGARNFFSQ